MPSEIEPTLLDSETPAQTAVLAQRRLLDRRSLLYLAILGLGVFVLLPKLIGFQETLDLLRAAHPVLLILALTAEATRYLVSAASTWLLARLFKRTVPFEPLVEAFFAGYAANRAFSTGGGPGMLVRLVFLMRHRVSAGSVAVIFLIEDIAGLVVGGLLFVAGAVALVAALPTEKFAAILAVIVAIGSPLILLAGWYVYRHRPWVEKNVHALARGLNALANWFTGQPLSTAESVQRGLDDFYVGVAVAQSAPLYVLAAFALNFLRYAVGAAALYFIFQSLNQPISMGVLIVLYTSASVLTTVSAIPGEVAIMATSLKLLSGVPQDIAVVAMLLSRTLSFWLPLPVGLLAFWNLRRRHDL